MTASPVRSFGGLIGCACVVFLGVGLRLIWLDADPDYFSWYGYLIDEGRWIENVRSLLLFDELLLPQGNVHLWVAPLFQAIDYVVFYFFDISRWSVRIFPALCGCGVLIALWVGLRDRIDTPALAVALTLVAVQEDLVVLSRIGIPEMPAMLIELIAFLMLVRSPHHLMGVLLAGILMMLGLGLKLTAAPTFLVFGLVAWFCGPAGLSNRLRSLFCFWGPALFLVLVALIVALIVGLLSGRHGAEWWVALIRDLPVIGSFIGVKGAYSMANFLFKSPLAPVLNSWALGIWVVGLVALAAPDHMAEPMIRLFKGALVWVLGYGAVMVSLSYFPDRYKVHILVPLAVIVAIAAQNLSRLGLEGLGERADGLKSLHRFAVLFLLALPPAVLLAPCIIALFNYANFDVDQLRWRILSIGLSWLLITLGLHHAGRAGPVFVVPFVLVATVTWLAGHHLAGWQFWTPAVDGGVVTQWSITLGLATGIALFMAGRLKQHAVLLAAVLVLYAGVSLVPYISFLTQRKYEARDISRELGTLLADYSSIADCRTEGFFIDNSLPFQSLYRLEWRKNPPEIMVMYKGDESPCLRDLGDYLSKNFQLIRTFEMTPPRRGQPYPDGIVVFRRIGVQ